MAPSSSAAPPLSVADTDLGLSRDEIASLRYHQPRALSQFGGSSTRAASHASNPSLQGRLLIDPNSLAALSNYFDNLMLAIQMRWQMLFDQTTAATQVQYDRAGNAIAATDKEIARMHAVIAQINELNIELEKIKNLGEIVKAFRARIEELDHRIGR